MPVIHFPQEVIRDAESLLGAIGEPDQEPESDKNAEKPHASDLF
jgi:hypothetical protein